MKVMTIYGTRPEIIRLSLIMKTLDEYCDQITVHTGQNYDKGLSDIFLEELEVRKPDIHMGIKSKSFGHQAGQILKRHAAVLRKFLLHFQYCMELAA
mgnify:CR=1 FL=1